MGQTPSQKHIKSEFLKNANLNPSSYASQGAYSQHGDFNSLSHEDLNEDEELSYPTFNSNKNSFSPSDGAPTLKFIPNLNNNRVENQVRKIPCVFRFNGRNGREVFLIGTFTSWKDKISMIRSDGDFVTIVDLPEGEYQYKFVVDGKWEHDPNQDTVNDNFNGKNNILYVKKSDFEVMEALENDANQPSQSSKPLTSNDDLSRSPPGEYTDELPLRGLNYMALDKPPYLPPQLLNIVLNKDTSSKCEPTLLPEPNHVMLKHLYALSIRDGVMVLSSTIRFKQKFITTCFYKPI